MDVTCDKILTHTKIWNDDVSILIIFTTDLCDWFYRYFINILVFFFLSYCKYQNVNKKSKFWHKKVIYDKVYFRDHEYLSVRKVALLETMFFYKILILEVCS